MSIESTPEKKKNSSSRVLRSATKKQSKIMENSPHVPTTPLQPKTHLNLFRDSEPNSPSSDVSSPSEKKRKQLPANLNSTFEKLLAEGSKVKVPFEISENFFSSPKTYSRKKRTENNEEEDIEENVEEESSRVNLNQTLSAAGENSRLSSENSQKGKGAASIYDFTEESDQETEKEKLMKKKFSKDLGNETSSSKKSNIDPTSAKKSNEQKSNTEQPISKKLNAEKSKSDRPSSMKLMAEKSNAENSKAEKLSANESKAGQSSGEKSNVKKPDQSSSRRKSSTPKLLPDNVLKKTVAEFAKVDEFKLEEEIVNEDEIVE